MKECTEKHKLLYRMNKFSTSQNYRAALRSACHSRAKSLWRVAQVHVQGKQVFTF